MECKFLLLSFLLHLIWVEVAPYWNVNHNTTTFTFKDNQVEVAPYWNVNEDIITELNLDENVEVAPYWNVNNHQLIFLIH